MPALVTDQLRILNTSNFIESVGNDSNSYYVFLSLPNPDINTFGRREDWDTNTPNPIDNFDNLNHVTDTIMFGKKISTENIRRVIRKIDWVKGTKYEMYRHDYSSLTPSPNTQASRLYDANYYVVNSEYRVYICLDNGSSGINTTGNASRDEPLFTDLEPSKAGESGDGYIWKYLYTISPSDVIKFDSTEYISVPNDWKTTTNPQIVSVRENSNSDVNQNQIKKVYIENQEFQTNLCTQMMEFMKNNVGTNIVNGVINNNNTQNNNNQFNLQVYLNETCKNAMTIDEFLDYLNDLKKSRPQLIITGDYNIAHKEIDIHDPKGNKNTTGFLPEERAWMDDFFASGWIDSFRQVHPEPHRYSWWSQRFPSVRLNNKGWRIDYINVTDGLAKKIKDAEIFPDIKHSDHCPVYLELSI